MPEGLLGTLSKEEILDLVAFARQAVQVGCGKLRLRIQAARDLGPPYAPAFDFPRNRSIGMTGLWGEV